MSCSCNILVSYIFQADPGDPVYTYSNLNISEDSIINGKSAYVWDDDNFPYTLYWSGTQWEVAIFYGEAYALIAAIFTEDLDCPGTNLISTWTPQNASWTNFTVEVSCQIVNIPEEEEDTEAIDCFNIIIWDLQCKFSKCVLKYFNGLKQGIDNKTEYNILLKKKKALDILLCYDAKDVSLNTTLYNNISYTKIKQLIRILNN